MIKAFDKIRASLEDAIAFANGDETKDGEIADPNTYAVRGDERKARASARLFASRAYRDDRFGWCA